MFDKKMTLFYIIDILKKYTDSNHFLTQQDIIDKLNSIYMIDLNRKTVSSTIDLLIDYGYDINYVPRHGYYLGERELDETELRFLIDALYSSKSLSDKNAVSIANKLSNNFSKYQKKDYLYLYKTSDNNTKRDNNLFLNIELINEAIKNKQKISFNYLTYNDEGNKVDKYKGFKYYVSPYFLVNNQGKYYLISNIRKYNNHSIFRIEYMTNIEILDEDIKPVDDVTTLGKNFDIKKFLDEHIYMFSGNIIKAKIELANSQAIGYVLDWFGNNAYIFKDNDKIFARIKSDEESLLYWLLQYQQYIKIIEPDDLITKFKNILTETLNKYKDHL